MWNKIRQSRKRSLVYGGEINMKKITGTEARDIICPFKFGTDWIYCDGLRCMAFKIIDRKYEREDHSGAREFLNRIKHEENRQEQKIIEEWQGGQKYLLLEERGYCARLYKKENKEC